MIALVIFAAAFLALVWLGWMILLFPTIAVAWRSGGRDKSPLAMPLPPRQASREEPGPASARSDFLLR